MAENPALNIGRPSARDRIVPRLEAVIKLLLEDHIAERRYHEAFSTLRDAIDAIQDLQRFVLNR